MSVTPPSSPKVIVVHGHSHLMMVDVLFVVSAGQRIAADLLPWWCLHILKRQDNRLTASKPFLCSVTLDITHHVKMAPSELCCSWLCIRSGEITEDDLQKPLLLWRLKLHWRIVFSFRRLVSGIDQVGSLASGRMDDGSWVCLSPAEFNQLQQYSDCKFSWASEGGGVLIWMMSRGV